MTPSAFLLLMSSWHPRSLFVSGEFGTIQVPATRAMYQDFGTTDAAIGSAVGLMLDEKNRLARWGQLITNGGFSVDTSGWSSGNAATLAAASGGMKITNAGATYGYAQQVISTTVGKTYEVTCSFTKGSAAAGNLNVGTGSASIDNGQAVLAASGVLRLIFVATAASTYVCPINSNESGAYGTYGNISVQEIPGNHAIQGTAGSRPTLNAGEKLNFSGGTKALVTTWASSLGSSCTVGRSIPQGEASILTGQTIGTSFTETTDNCGLVIINRALSSTETNQLRRWLNRRAG